MHTGTTIRMDSIWELFRDNGREDVVTELRDTAKDARTYYVDSGDLYKHVGVLRAFDIFWSKERSATFVYNRIGSFILAFKKKKKISL